MKRRMIVGFCALALVLMGGCSSDSDDTPGTDATVPGSDASVPGADTGTDPNQGKTFEEAITAAAGGKLATDDGSAAIDVPAGALAADTTLTLKVAAKEADTATSVYEFGPDGTQFLKPVTLSIKYGGDPGADKKAVLATYEGGKWVEIPGSSAAGGMVSGEISHFSKFAIIIVDGQAVLVSGCSDVATAFKACGGDVQGMWQFDDVCFEDFPLGKGAPWAENCPEATFTFDIIWDATINITATSMNITWKSQTTKMDYIAPNSCLGTAECSDVSNSDLTCVSEGASCKCSGEKISTDLPPMEVPYTIDGTNVVTDVDGKKTTAPYCVQGDKLIIKTSMPTGDGELPYYQVLTRVQGA